MIGLHQWDKSITIFVLSGTNRNLPLGHTNYAGCAGANGKTTSTADDQSCTPDGQPLNLSLYEGIFTNRSKTAMGRIPDGTSNTLMFGEGTGGFLRDNKTLAVSWSWMGMGAISTKFGLGQPGLDYGNSLPGASWSTFSSRHPGGVNFCFADGSVRMLKFGSTTKRCAVPTPTGGTCQCPGSLDFLVLQQLGGMRDGQVIQNPIE
jgi:prepilin-type processing-associated H-X9-DG protein